MDVCILLGRSAPVLLEKHNNHYHLKASCYMQGWMKGGIPDEMGRSNEEIFETVVSGSHSKYSSMHSSSYPPFRTLIPWFSKWNSYKRVKFLLAGKPVGCDNPEQVTMRTRILFVCCE